MSAPGLEHSTYCPTEPRRRAAARARELAVRPVFARALAAALTLAGPWTVSRAEAQITPTSPEPKPEEKKEGVAEEAPETPGELPTTPTLPPPKSERKRFELFELDGYFRFRGDWFKKFNLGFDDDPALGGAPFPRPLACGASFPDKNPCESTLKSANIRLRLWPTINISERTAVHFQVDALDNVVLGSTPQGFNPGLGVRPGDIPLNSFSMGQEPPYQGRNSFDPSVVVRRAWGEVMTPLGLLKFGRMPTNWGLGMLINSGDTVSTFQRYDLLNSQANRNLDSDFGDTVDRISFSGAIPGTAFLAAIAMDWAATPPVADQVGIFNDRRDRGQPWDLDDNDDVNQWVFAIADVLGPDKFAEKVKRGEFALSYGGYLAYRTQSFDVNPFDLGTQPNAETDFVERGYKAFIPDAWVHLAFDKFDFEAEGAAIIGKIGTLTDVGLTSPDQGSAVDLRQFGGVARGSYKLLDGDLRVMGEVGYASGDQFDNDPQGRTYISNTQLFPTDLMQDGKVTRFFFNPDYQIDLILFRELIGTVTNATYLRPGLEYDITDKFRARGQSVISFANKPISTPGNGSMYGVEFDADVGYHSGGFFAGIAYGVLFPLSAMDHPADIAGQGGPGFGYGANSGGAQTAQTIQTRLVLTF